MLNTPVRYNSFNSKFLEWAPVILGLTALYAPTFFDLSVGLWSNESQFHGPVILLISSWLVYRKWPLLYPAHNSWFRAPGWSLFVLGLLLYIIGRSQQIIQFELASLICVCLGILLVKFGKSALHEMWFPFFFMLFMIPLPGTIVITLTMPMKLAVSYAVEHILFWMKLPVARSGVILHIGQYQLLVADACAGLQTLLTLEALGLLYLNVVQHSSTFRNLMLAILIIPISFVANVIRVLSLTLITYYWGEDAGQGYAHQFAGVTLFLAGLMLIIALDSLLRLMSGYLPGNKTAAGNIRNA